MGKRQLLKTLKLYKVWGKRMKNNRIYIACASDQNFGEPLTVMLYSLIKNSTSPYLTIYIFDGGLSRKQKLVLENMAISLDVVIYFIEIDSSKFKSFSTSNRLTYTTYYRLLIPEVLPCQLNKIIYLDCDILVEGDITKLWNTNIENKAIAAVPEIGEWCRFVSSPGGVALYKELGIPNNSKYFNAGVLYINIKKWRKKEIANKIFTYLNNNQKYVRYHDQDGLNAILWNDWYELIPTWNVLTEAFMRDISPTLSLDEDTIKSITNSPNIVHFTGAQKPWQTGCKHPYSKIYTQYCNDLKTKLAHIFN